MEPDKQVLITKQEQIYINCITQAVNARYYFTMALAKLKEMKNA